VVVPNVCWASMTFSENWRSESHTWLGGVNKFLILVSIFVWHVWVKFDTEDLHVMPYINYAFIKNSRLNNITFLNVENKRLRYYLQISFSWDKIRSGRCAQQVQCSWDFVKIDWVEATSRTGVNYPHLSHLLSSLGEVRYEISVMILFIIFVKIVAGKVIVFLRSFKILHLYRII
jgi:hypothetical protein